MFEPGVYHESFKYTGVKLTVNFPVPAPLYKNSSRSYPTYNTSIPDQFRIDMFIIDRRIFDPQKALDPLDEKFDWKSLSESLAIDKVEDMMSEAKELEKGRLENRERKK